MASLSMAGQSLRLVKLACHEAIACENRFSVHLVDKSKFQIYENCQNLNDVSRRLDFGEGCRTHFFTASPFKMTIGPSNRSYITVQQKRDVANEFCPGLHYWALATKYRVSHRGMTRIKKFAQEL